MRKTLVAILLVASFALGPPALAQFGYRLINNGAAASKYDVVIVDTGLANSFTTTNVAKKDNVIGVLWEDTGNAASGIVVLPGSFATVTIMETVAIGDYLITSTTVGSAGKAAAGDFMGVFAVSLEAGNATDQVNCILVRPNPIGATTDLNVNTLTVNTLTLDEIDLPDGNTVIKFGAGDDIQMGYDEAGEDRLEVTDGTNVLSWLKDAGTTGDFGITGLSTLATLQVADGLDLGDEQITNGDMELDSDWGARGSPTTSERSNEQAHGGTFSWKTVADSTSDGMTQTFGTVGAGTKLKVDCWVYNTGGASMKVHVRLAEAPSTVYGDLTCSISASWIQYTFYATATSTGPVQFQAYEPWGAGTFYVDDVSVKALDGDLMVSDDAHIGDDLLVGGDVAVEGTITGEGNIATSGDLIATGGDLTLGDATTRGTVSLNGIANAPGYMKLEDANGVPYYVFCSNTGIVRVHTAAPTTGGEGSMPHEAGLEVVQTISSDWINVADPWADNEVVDGLTVDNTGNLSAPPAIGGTTPAAGTFTTMIVATVQANTVLQGNTDSALTAKADTNIVFHLDEDNIDDPNAYFEVVDGADASCFKVTEAGVLSLDGAQIDSDDLSDTASIAMLDENETITGNWDFDGNVAIGDTSADTATIIAPSTFTMGAGAAGAAEVAHRFGLTTTEGLELHIIDDDINMASVISQDLAQNIPTGAVILSVQCNLETAVVPTGGTGTKIGIGDPAVDPDLYGLTTSTVQNQKIDTIPDWAVLGAALDLQVNFCDAAGALATLAVSSGIVRVHIVFYTLNSLDNA